jgi:hypothetical protein
VIVTSSFAPATLLLTRQLIAAIAATTTINGSLLLLAVIRFPLDANRCSDHHQTRPNTRPLNPWEGYYKTQPAGSALREKGRRASRLDASVLLDA